MNLLAQETSPYLLQHADNPVEWFPWGEEAFKKARKEDKPILLSVGYSACHWCHVMAHESFEDSATAELMNKHFVNVKVDREERPDVDAIYMNAVQAMTGHGGWPMTVVMTPEAKPFFGGTYYPKEDRYGQPSFTRVLMSLADAWQNRRDEVMSSAENATKYLGALSSFKAEGDLDPSTLRDALKSLAASFDSQHGGFGTAPKFPPHSALKFLLRQEDAHALATANLTLTKMARGGIYDHIGGGFARYSVDAIWLVPHFEKMLYDNAQLVQRFAEAYVLTGESLYKEVVEETLSWVMREMTAAEGGFYSALDADSEGEEGKYYLWDVSEIDALLGQDAEFAKRYFDISEAGNFEGRNIPNVKENPAELAKAFDLSQEALKNKLKTIKKTLYAEREKRIRPGLDDKILTSWNGLMLAAFADAARIFESEEYLNVALKNAQFIKTKLYSKGRLKHSYKEGVAKIEGLLEDYAYYALGLVSLYRASFEAEWLELAFELAEAIVAHFYDDTNGGFFSTADDAEKLIIRPKNYFDSPNPSENAATAELLISLARYGDKPEWEELAVTSLKAMQDAVAKQPTGFGTMLCALEYHLSPPREVALVGQMDKTMAALTRELNAHLLPYTQIAHSASEKSSLADKLPFLSGKTAVAGRATAYVCEGGVCSLPVTTVEALREELVNHLDR